MLRVIVVFDHKDGGYLQHNCHVHGLETGPLVDRAVARKRYRYFAVFADLGSQCRSDRNGWATGNDTIRTEDALVDIGNVHRAAFALAKALRGPK